MSQDNTKLGYAYSVVLHLFVAAAVFAYAMVDMLFPKDTQENKVVFDMVEPSTNPPEPPAPNTAPDTPDLKVEKPDEIKPIDIPEPQPPEEQPPEPAPTPTPTPAPKKIEQPQPPKKISIDDFKKKNPKRATNKETPSQPVRRPVKIGQISANTSNLDTMAITPSRNAPSSSQAMLDALSEYTRTIYIIAKRNWKVPTINTDSISAKVAFRVSKTGIISGVKIVESSGDADFDNSIIQVLKSITIPPPPDNESHTIYIRFKAQ